MHVHKCAHACLHIQYASKARARLCFLVTAVTDLHFCQAFLKASEADGEKDVDIQSHTEV